MTGDLYVFVVCTNRQKLDLPSRNCVYIRGYGRVYRNIVLFTFVLAAEVNLPTLSLESKHFSRLKSKQLLDGAGQNRERTLHWSPPFIPISYRVIQFDDRNLSDILFSPWMEAIVQPTS
ncbi:hypothetical protein FRC03_008237 [Tulasnella sp. 419]|nr:hypothetical protein FRC03_008237 [Tulasnella sp. 419]